MGIYDGCLSVSLSSEVNKIATFKDTFKCIGRGMNIKNLEDFLKQSDSASNEFKVLIILV